MKTAVFNFPQELHCFLKPSNRKPAFDFEFNGPQSVKHLIEAAGVPHTEVNSVRVNGSPVNLDYLVKDGDQVEITPYLTFPHFSENDQLKEPRFILDNHLGKLTSYLRMLGFDCLYSNRFQDDELAQLAQEENRILLTRDHRLLMRKTIQVGYWLRSQDPFQQVREIADRYALYEMIKPFQRCMRCNQVLVPVPKQAIQHRLQPLTKKYFDEFRICPDCQQIYWQGSHFAKMQIHIQKIIQDQFPS